jgi:1-acyl-sn-glycerol-3-phosphate acyltransferase
MRAAPVLLAPLALWRVLRVALHLLHGMAVMALRFPSLDAAGRHARIGWWSAGLLRAVGVGLQVRGTPRPGASLLLANHVSWLDVAALHAAVPHARFVSKADVLHWPLLGWLVKNAGTLFIERERKRDALRVVHAMADAMRAGETVAVFPEGTTGLGPQLLPFHANLLQAAIATATPIQPAVLRFADAGQRFSPAVEFVGETTLLQSLWRVATARGLVVYVELLAPQTSAHADRRALAEHLRGLMAERLCR